jgi:ectoine hydroxylase-related dioxygenase (phytanoyl-CoA dioxygenase family)
LQCSTNLVCISAVASQSVNDVFSATYDYYVIKLGITANTAATDSVINLRLRVSGTDASTNYITQRIFNTSTTVTGQQDPTGTDRWYFTESSTTNPHQYATMEIFNPFVAAVTTGIAHTSFRANTGSTYMNIAAFRNTNATSYTGFSLLNSTGNITGSVSVFGVNK